MIGSAYAQRIAAAQAFAEASAALGEALLASFADPADAVRLLLPLTRWQAPPIPGDGPGTITALDVQGALASNLRCSACAALARAAALYQPHSYQDATSLRQMVCAALDEEATRCADAGRDASYLALRELRAAVALDLAVRGADLAVLVEVTTAQSTPSLAQAWTLYQDTSREPELVASARPPHPLFMPLTFQALAR